MKALLAGTLVVKSSQDDRTVSIQKKEEDNSRLGVFSPLISVREEIQPSELIRVLMQTLTMHACINQHFLHYIFFLLSRSFH